MADINAIATLGLELDASQAQASATQFGQTLADLGTKSTASAAAVSSASDKVTASLTQQYATLQDAQRAWESQARAMGGVTQAGLLTQAEIAKSTAAYDAMVTQMKAVPVAATQAATSVAAIGTAADRSTFPLGRLRQSFASLAAQATGTNPIIDRIIVTLAAMAGGNLPVIAIVAALAAIGGAYRLLTGDARKLAEEAEKATDALMKAQNLKRAGVEGNLIDQLYGTPATAHTKATDGLNQDLENQQKILKQMQDAQRATHDFAYGATHLDASKYAVEHFAGSPDLADAGVYKQQQMVKSIQDAQKEAQTTLKAAQVKNTTSQVDEHTRQLAELITSNKNNAAARAQGLSEYQADVAKLAAFQKAHPGLLTTAGVAAESALQAPVDTLKNALYPQKAVTQGYREDDTLTRFQQQLAAFKQQADAFGKDDSIVAQMKRFSEELEHQITVLQRAGDAKSRAQVPVYQALLGQVPAVTTLLQGKVQTQADTEVQARITKLHDEQVAQDALNATRSQSADAVRAVMIANAASLTVEAAKAEYAKQGITLSKALTDQLYAQAAATEASKKSPSDLTAVANAKSLVSGIQNAQDLGVGDPAKELQDIADAYSAAIDQQMFLNDSSKDYLDLQETINILLRERKQILDAMAKSQHQLSKDAEAYVRGVATIINTASGPTHASPQLGDLEGVATNAAGAIASGGENVQADIGTVTDTFKFLADAFNSNAQNIQEQKEIERANTDAIIQMTLKLQGFIPQSVSNAASAASAIAAFEANGAAVSQLTNAQSSTGWSGRKSGDLQTQINALTPFLQASGLTYNQFMDIAKADGINLLDKNGRIVAATLAQFETALTAATQAAFTLTQSFSDQSGIDTLLGKFQGQTTIQDQFKQQYAAFQTASGNAGPNVNPTTLAGENAIRAWGTQVIQAIKAASVPGAAPFDYSKYGSFTNVQQLENALGTLIDPLNQLTNTVNGVVDSLTNVPTGFKVAYDRYLSTTGAAGTITPFTPPSKLTTQNTAQGTVTITGPVTLNITSPASSYNALIKDVGVQLQNSNTRGGTSRTAYAIQQANQ